MSQYQSHAFVWFIDTLAIVPLFLTLIVGAIICYRQRRRRPSVAKWLGIAIVLTLLVDFGSSIFFTLITIAAQQTNSPQLNSSIVFALCHMIFRLLDALFWALAFWSVLGVEERTVDDLDSIND